MTTEQLNEALANESANHPHRADDDARHPGLIPATFAYSHYVGRHRDAIMDRTPMVDDATLFAAYATNYRRDTDETSSGWLDV